MPKLANYVQPTFSVCISGPYMVCLSGKGSYQTSQMTGTHHFCLRQLVSTIVSLYAEVGQKKLIKQCKPKSDCAHRNVIIRVCTVRQLILGFVEHSVYTRGWSGGAMVQGKLPVPRRPTVLIIIGQGSTALAVGAGGCCLDIFTLICSFSPLSPSLLETARYRLKYCLRGPLNPKQPTNQSVYIKLKFIFRNVHDRTSGFVNKINTD